MPVKSHRPPQRRIALCLGAACLSWLCLTACQPHSVRAVPVIEFTTIPPAGDGSPDKLQKIAGRVANAQPGQRVVLFARSGMWWVQPTVANPFTTINRDLSWTSETHPGSAYAALLVTPEYRPPPTLARLPEQSGHILARAVADGATLTRAPRPTITFSGYEWERREDPSDRSGTRNQFSPANAWVDQKGYLHLRISGEEGNWTSAEVRLARSLGYGSYRFVVSDVSHLEPAAVFSILAWDDSEPLEMDIEVSRWGETASKNAQYVIQPYYVPANVFRYMVPRGPVTFSFRWEPGRASFRTDRGSAMSGGAPVSAHDFTSGVPSPGNEAVHINLYSFRNATNPLRHGNEVVVEKFEYLP